MSDKIEKIIQRDTNINYRCRSFGEKDGNLVVLRSAHIKMIISMASMIKK